MLMLNAYRTGSEIARQAVERNVYEHIFTNYNFRSTWTIKFAIYSLCGWGRGPFKSTLYSGASSLVVVLLVSIYCSLSYGMELVHICCSYNIVSTTSFKNRTSK